MITSITVRTHGDGRVGSPLQRGQCRIRLERHQVVGGTNQAWKHTGSQRHQDKALLAADWESIGHPTIHA